jgi:N-acetylglucosaminyldiphosphoundecaprenol N-acetyl-beta-D-mannosaminyltransferase
LIAKARRPQRLPERIELLGAPLDPLTMKETVDLVDGLIERGESAQQASLNAAKVVRIQHDKEFLAALESCDLVLADGVPIVWAGRLLGRRIPERVAGFDLMMALFERAAERGHRVFLLGARPRAVSAAKAEIERRHPDIQIVGAHHGYYSAEEEPEVIAEIAAARPDLLFVALETPQKELLLARVREALEVPFAMGVGGSLDILAGDRVRAPVWMQRAGLEWLFRFIQEPRRLGRRYVVGNSIFVGLVLREILRERVRPNPGRGTPA